MIMRQVREWERQEEKEKDRKGNLREGRKKQTEKDPQKEKRQKNKHHRAIGGYTGQCPHFSHLTDEKS